MSDSFSDLSVVMATLNEEKAIAKTIQDIQEYTNHEAEILIVDGSTDNTPFIAEKMGVTVIRQKPRGYGIAIKAALLAASKNIIITLDCDATYPAEAIPGFVELIRMGYDVVSGSRIRNSKKSMSRMNWFGNILFAKLTSLLYGISVTDVTTGMRAYRRAVIHTIDWTENTGLSAELIFRPAKKHYKIIEIPIDYRPRVGETKLNPISGGLEILISILKYRFKE